MNDLPDNELLSAYLDGELTAAEQAEVERLLRRSPHARKTLEELRAMSQSLQSLPQRRLGEDLSEEVLRLAECRMLLEPGDLSGGAGPAADDGLDAVNARAGRNDATETSPRPKAAAQTAGEAPVELRAEPSVVAARGWDRRRALRAGAQLARRLVSSRALAWSAAAVAVALLLSVSRPPTAPRRAARELASSPAIRPTAGAASRELGEAMDKEVDGSAGPDAPAAPASPETTTMAKAPASGVIGDADVDSPNGRTSATDFKKYGAAKSGERPTERDWALKSKDCRREAHEEIAAIEPPTQLGAAPPTRVESKIAGEALDKRPDAASPALESSQIVEKQPGSPVGGDAFALAGADYIVVQCDLSPEAAAGAAFERVLARNFIHWEAEESIVGRQLALGIKKDVDGPRQVVGGMGAAAPGGDVVDSQVTGKPSLETPAAPAPGGGDAESRLAPANAPSTAAAKHDDQPDDRRPPHGGPSQDVAAQSVPAQGAPGRAGETLRDAAPAEGQVLNGAAPVGPLELVLVEASASQIEATLQQMAAAPDQFVNLSVEPAPGAQSQNALRQYERRRDLNQQRFGGQLALGAAANLGGGAGAEVGQGDCAKQPSPVASTEDAPRAPAAPVPPPMAEPSPEPAGSVGKHSAGGTGAASSRPEISQAEASIPPGQSVAARNQQTPDRDQYQNVQNRAGRARRIPLFGAPDLAANRQLMSQRAAPPTPSLAPSHGTALMPAFEPAQSAQPAPPSEVPATQPVMPPEPGEPPSPATAATPDRFDAPDDLSRRQAAPAHSAERVPSDVADELRLGESQVPDGMSRAEETPPAAPSPAQREGEPLARQSGVAGPTAAGRLPGPSPVQRPQSQTGQAIPPVGPGQRSDSQAAQMFQTDESSEPTYRVLFVLRVAPSQSGAEAAARARQLDASQSAAEDRFDSEADGPAAAAPPNSAPPPAAEATEPAPR